MYYVTYVSRTHGSKKHEHLRGVFCPDQSNEMEKKSCGAARKFENFKKKTINMFIKIIKIVGTMATKQYLNHSSSKKKKTLVIPTHAPLQKTHSN